MASTDEEMEKLAIQAQLAQQQGQALQSQLDMLQGTMTDLNMTIDTIRNLKKAKSQSLLPIGSGTYITCQKVDPDNVMVSVGGGVIVVKKADDAAELLEKRLKMVSDAFDKAQKDFFEVNRRISDLNTRAAALAGQMENVRPA